MTRHTRMLRDWFKPLLLVAALGAQVGIAQAQTACADFGTQSQTSDSTLSIALDTGDTASVSGTGLGFTILVEAFGATTPFSVVLRQTSPDSTSYTSPEDGVTLLVFPIFVVSSTITISCTPAVAPASNDLVAQASSISAATQSRAITNGVSANTRSRFSGAGSNTVSRDGLFVSTQNMSRSSLETPDFNLWISGEFRSFRGELDGYSADLLLGVDRLINQNLLAGLLLAYGRTDLDDGLGEASVDSPALGAYFARRFVGELILDGYVTYARPRTETAGTTFSSDRISAGLMLNGYYDLPEGTLRPYATINASIEDQPTFIGSGGPVAANQLRNYAASVGARFESSVPLGTTALLPYVSGGIDYGYNHASLTGSDDFLFPRIGFGIAGPVGAGYLGIDVDAGKVRSETYDVGVSFVYEATF